MRACVHVLVCLCLSMMKAWAAPAEVRAVQAPAWRVHDELRVALTPGMALDARDRIETGAGARVLLALSEGSTVKLGENAVLSLDSLVEPSDAGGLFQGVLNVVRGAFRFTTTVVGRRRAIQARVGTATIGIRGTDVWGKHEEARDFVVLLEGQIDIERAGQTVNMSTPQSLFMAPNGKPALPVAPVNPDDLAHWAQETEPQAGGGLRDGQGHYRLMFKLEEEAAAANALAEQLAQAGHGAQVMEVRLGGRTAYRTVIGGYTSETEARAAASALAGRISGLRPWVSRD